MLLAIFLLAWDLTAIESVDVRRRMWRPRDPEIIHSIQQTTQTTLFNLKVRLPLNELLGRERVSSFNIRRHETSWSWPCDSGMFDIEQNRPREP